jgi:hypothetical protein
MISETPIDDETIGSEQDTCEIIADDQGMIGHGMPRTDDEYKARMDNGIERADKQFKLRARDRLFLQYYLDITNKDTYLHPQAALRKANADKPLAYHVRSSQILSRLRRIGAYDLVLNTIGAGVEVRLHHLARIASGATESTETIYDADGCVKARKVKTPTSREQIAALQELNRMDGTYGRLKIAAKVQGEYAKDEYTRLRERARKAIEDAASGRRIAPERKQTGKDTPIVQEAEIVEARDEDRL